jgi:hypothetical protein
VLIRAHWYAGEEPESWEECLGLGPDGRPADRARELIAVRLYGKEPVLGDMQRFGALTDSPLARVTLPGSRWAPLRANRELAQLKRETGELAQRVLTATGLTVEEAIERVRPVIDLFDDASIGLPDIGPGGFGWKYGEIVPMATGWSEALYYDEKYEDFDPSGLDDRATWERWFVVEEFGLGRARLARTYAQACEAVAYFAVCRRYPDAMFSVQETPRQGWPGWLSGLAEYGRVALDSSSDGYDLANAEIARLIGDEARARATFVCLGRFARECYEPVPPNGADYLEESLYINRALRRFLELYPLPRPDAVALVGEIALLLGLAPEGPALDRVPGLLGFPPGPRRPWGWRGWLDQLAGQTLSQLNLLPGC